MERDDPRERLRQHMQERGIRQAPVARSAGLTPQVFNDILHGRRPLRTQYIVRICAETGITPNELFGWEEVKGDGTDRLSNCQS